MVSELLPRLKLSKKKTNHQATIIYSLQTQVKSLELSSRTQSSLGLTAMQEELNNLCRKINSLKETPPCSSPAGHSPFSNIYPSINVFFSAAYLAPMSVQTYF